MKPTLTAMLLVLALCAGEAAARKSYFTPTSASDFAEIVTPLTEQATAYAAKADDAAPAAGASLASVHYSMRSAAALEAALKARHDDPLAEMYIAWQLLQPLHKAGDDLLVKLRPTMTDLLDRCKYEPMPDWPKSMLKTLATPRKKAPKSVEQARRRRREAALAKKREAERDIVKHNRMAHALETTLKGLLVLMGDEDADAAMCGRFRRETDEKWTTYAHTLDALRRQAVRMKQPQAKRYYDTLLDVVRKHPKPRQYADPTRPGYSDEGDSSFQARQQDLPTETLKIVNLLATSARQPAVIVTPPKKTRKPPDRNRRNRRR